MFVPPTFKGEPRLLSAHIYDPNTRLSVFFDPQTRPRTPDTSAPSTRSAANSVPPQSPAPTTPPSKK